MTKKQRLRAFRREYRHDTKTYLNRKILAGKRLRLSLFDIARALEIPLPDVELEWDYIRQDAR